MCIDRAALAGALVRFSVLSPVCQKAEIKKVQNRIVRRPANFLVFVPWRQAAAAPTRALLKAKAAAAADYYKQQVESSPGLDSQGFFFLFWNGPYSKVRSI